MSRIRTNLITNRMANGAPTVSNGLVISGVTTSTTFSGSGASLTNLPAAQLTGALPALDGSNLTGITQTTINNNADNRVITGTGSANTLNAESNVHVDGSGRLLVGTSTNNAHANADNAVISGTGNIGLSIMSTDSGRSSIYFGDSSSSPGSYAGFIDFIHSSNSFNIGRGNDNSLTIDSSGQMGLGVSPNANWPTNNDFKALQIGTGACVFGRGSGDEDRGGIAVNWYSDGSNNKYIGNGNAARIYLADGNIYFSTAGANSSGANASMTLNDRFIIDSDGNVHINNSNNLKKFSVREGSSSSGVYYNAHIGGASHLANYAVGIGFDPEGYPARTKIGIVAEGTSSGYSRGKLHFLLDNANDSGEATLSEARMTINDSGQVTKPNQPSFAAYVGSNPYTLNNQVFPFNNTNHNIGNHFNTSNYRFTAPVAGRYLFNFHSIFQTSGQQDVQLRINNSSGSGKMFHVNNANSNWDLASCSYILNLNANDYVTMWSVSNTGWHGNNWGMFSGELLS